MFLLSILIMAALWQLAPIGTFAAFPYNLGGVALFVLGIGIAKHGSDVFRKADTNISTFNDPDILITEGIYRYTRNPMYLGFVIALLGVAVVLGSVSALIVVVLFILITDRWYIEFEEAAMQRMFGSRYDDYKQKTRRWL